MVEEICSACGSQTAEREEREPEKRELWTRCSLQRPPLPQLLMSSGWVLHCNGPFSQELAMDESIPPLNVAASETKPSIHKSSGGHFTVKL